MKLFRALSRSLEEVLGPLRKLTVLQKVLLNYEEVPGLTEKFQIGLGNTNNATEHVSSPRTLT